MDMAGGMMFGHRTSSFLWNLDREFAWAHTPKNSVGQEQGTDNEASCLAAYLEKFVEQGR
jgi:hypothetical protein